MDRITHLAEASVRRGCMFALLAICTVMWGLSFDFGLALRAGAILTSIGAVVLWFMAEQAPRWNVRSTELWALLRKGEDLPPGYPPEALLETLKQSYVRHATLATIVALALWAGTALVWALRALRDAAA